MTEPMFLPTAEGARDVLHRARRRRRRQVLLTAVAVATVVGAATGATLPTLGSGADRVTVVSTSPTPSPSPTATSTPAKPATDHASTGRNVRPGGPGGTAAAPPVSVEQPVDSPSAPAHRHSAAAPITRTTVTFTSQCDATNDVVGWCVVYSGPSTVRRKHAATLSMELCRVPVAGDGQMTFYDTREVDLSVSDGDGKLFWQAGQGGRNINKEHTLTVRGGTCLRWSAVWDTIGRDGFYAPPGNYYVSYSPDSGDQVTGGGQTLTVTD